MTVVFVDTGAWYALLNRLDAHHLEAARFVEQAGGHFLTTNYVVLETVNLLNARVGHGPAVAFLDHLKASKAVTIQHATSRQHQAAEVYFKRHADKAYSLTDCVSFVMMDELGLSEAFAFDKHFSQAGFSRLP